jgi:uncharacterized membrane protein
MLEIFSMRVPVVVATVFLLATVTAAMATTKHERCETYAHNAMESTPTSTGVVRGAARGAVGGAILGNAGAGAATGAVIGTARRAHQKSRSYQYYYDSCMSR